MENQKCVIGAHAGVRLKELLEKAELEVTLSTAFIDEFGAELLCKLAHKGVEVKVILPKNTIHSNVIQKLMKCGVQVFIVSEFVHSKLYLIDGKGYTSSANLTRPALTGKNIEHLCSEDYVEVKRMIKELEKSVVTSRSIVVNVNSDLERIARPKLIVRKMNEVVDISIYDIDYLKMLVSLSPPRTVFIKNDAIVLRSRTPLWRISIEEVYNYMHNTCQYYGRRLVINDSRCWLKEYNDYYYEMRKCIEDFYEKLAKNGYVYSDEKQLIVEWMTDLAHVVNWLATQILNEMHNKNVIEKIVSLINSECSEVLSSIAFGVTLSIQELKIVTEISIKFDTWRSKAKGESYIQALKPHLELLFEDYITRFKEVTCKYTSSNVSGLSCNAQLVFVY